MRHIKSFWTVILLLLSCEEDLEISASGLLNNQSLTIEHVYITDSGNGVYIELISTVGRFHLWLNDKKSGLYPIFNTSIINDPINLEPPGQLFAVAEYIDQSGIVHYGVSGKLTFSRSGGVVNGTFSFEGEDIHDNEITLTHGAFTGYLKKSTLTECTIQSTARNPGYVETNTYGYDHAGKLISVINISDEHFLHVFFSSENTRFLAVTEVGFNATRSYIHRTHYFINYDGNRISAIQSGFNFEALFKYNSANLLNQVNYNTGFEATINYDGNGNIISNEGSILLYDDKVSYSQPFLKSLHSQQAILVLFNNLFYVVPTPSSKNNVIRIGDFDIELFYNSNNYPIQWRYINSPGFQGVTIEYINCK